MIEVPFPPAILSGHNTGNHFKKAPVVKKFRQWAHFATLEANPSVPEHGDIPIRFTFYPPDNRGDRTNYPNRIKPIIDGVADALMVNDKRFLPSYVFMSPEKPGKVIIEIGHD